VSSNLQQKPDAKELHVAQFSNGALGITCKGMALHLNPDEATALAACLRTLYPEAAGTVAKARP
jgi:hypothetical protein